MERKMIKVKTTCPACHHEKYVYVYKEDYAKYKNGEGLIQDLMPYLNDGDRGLLMTGICKDCWDSMFPEDEKQEGRDNGCLS